MTSGGWCIAPPHFLFFFQKKKRKRAVHGPKEKKKYTAFLTVEHLVGAAAFGGPSPRAEQDGGAPE